MGTSGTAGTAAIGARKLSDQAVEHAARRGISRATLERLGAASATVFFPTLGRKSEAVFWPYTRGGDVVNWKAAAFPEKAFTSKPGGELRFFNLDAALRAKPDSVFIVEGEWDAAALVESGIDAGAVLSVPNGAREAPQASDGPLRGYEYVTEALSDGLNLVNRFVWCGDADGPGHALRQDMVRIFGPARFWFVDWPDGAKDANACLLSDGAPAVRDLVLNGALPWPVEGMYRLSELPDPPPVITWDAGFDEWESKVRLGQGMLSVVTGHPGHGKTQLWAQIWAQVVRRHKLVACIASFETTAKPHLQRTLQSVYHGRLAKDLTQDQWRAGNEWINAHYLWIQHPDQKPTLEWVLDRAEIAVVRYGARVLQIDPWNRLEGVRPPGEPETDYIGRCLTALYVFAQQMGCHVQVLAHPAKMSNDRRGKPPELEDIAGSKHWDNRVDQGFVVHRPKVWDDGERKTEAVLYHRKARFEALGYPCALDLVYDLSVGRYRSTDYEKFGGP